MTSTTKVGKATATAILTMMVMVLATTITSSSTAGYIAGFTFVKMRVSQNSGYIFGAPHDKDGSYWGPPLWKKVPSSLLSSARRAGQVAQALPSTAVSPCPR